MQLDRSIRLASWNESAAQVAVAYLQSRKFLDANASPASSGLTVTGTRGSWFGNFTSFDMAKLRASIRLASKGDGTVDVRLDVNTLGQQITDWNTAFWRLELLELRRVLTGLGGIDDVWRRFEVESRAAAGWWLVIGTRTGQKMPAAWIAELIALEST